MKIEVKNEGLTNSMAFARHNEKYDIDSLLKREGIYDKIVELASHEYYCKGNGGDIKWSFNNLINSIYTCIKCAREQNFNEEFWKDWEDLK